MSIKRKCQNIIAFAGKLKMSFLIIICSHIVVGKFVIRKEVQSAYMDATYCATLEFVLRVNFKVPKLAVIAENKHRLSCVQVIFLNSIAIINAEKHLIVINIIVIRNVILENALIASKKLKFFAFVKNSLKKLHVEMRISHARVCVVNNWIVGIIFATEFVMMGNLF